MVGRSDNDCERSGDHDVARMAAVAGTWLDGFGCAVETAIGRLK